MDNAESVELLDIDYLAKGLCFDIETASQNTEQGAASQLQNTQLNIKVKINRKKLRNAIVIVPEYKERVPVPLKVGGSDETLLSFKMLMEKKKSTKRASRDRSKRKLYLLGQSMPGGCLDPPYDERQNLGTNNAASTGKSNQDAEPHHTDKMLKINSRTSDTCDDKYRKQTEIFSDYAKKAPSMLKSRETPRNTYLMGLSLPGGCLDPPFDEIDTPYRKKCKPLATHNLVKTTPLMKNLEKENNQSQPDNKLSSKNCIAPTDVTAMDSINKLMKTTKEQHCHQNQKLIKTRKLDHNMLINESIPSTFGTEFERGSYYSIKRASKENSDIKSLRRSLLFPETNTVFMRDRYESETTGPDYGNISRSNSAIQNNEKDLVNKTLYDSKPIPKVLNANESVHQREDADEDRIKFNALSNNLTGSCGNRDEQTTAKDDDLNMPSKNSEINMSYKLNNKSYSIDMNKMHDAVEIENNDVDSCDKIYQGRIKTFSNEYVLTNNSIKKNQNESKFYENKKPCLQNNNNCIDKNGEIVEFYERLQHINKDIQNSTSTDLSYKNSHPLNQIRRDKLNSIPREINNKQPNKQYEELFVKPVDGPVLGKDVMSENIVILNDVISNASRSNFQSFQLKNLTSEMGSQKYISLEGVNNIEMLSGSNFTEEIIDRSIIEKPNSVASVELTNYNDASKNQETFIITKDITIQEISSGFGIKQAILPLATSSNRVSQFSEITVIESPFHQSTTQNGAEQKRKETTSISSKRSSNIWKRITSFTKTKTSEDISKQSSKSAVFRKPFSISSSRRSSRLISEVNQLETIRKLHSENNFDENYKEISEDETIRSYNNVNIISSNTSDLHKVLSTEIGGYLRNVKEAIREGNHIETRLVTPETTKDNQNRELYPTDIFIRGFDQILRKLSTDGSNKSVDLLIIPQILNKPSRVASNSEDDNEQTNKINTTETVTSLTHKKPEEPRKLFVSSESATTENIIPIVDDVILCNGDKSESLSLNHHEEVETGPLYMTTKSNKYLTHDALVPQNKDLIQSDMALKIIKLESKGQPYTIPINTNSDVMIMQSKNGAFVHKIKDYSNPDILIRNTTIDHFTSELETDFLNKASNNKRAKPKTGSVRLNYKTSKDVVTWGTDMDTANNLRHINSESLDQRSGCNETLCMALKSEANEAVSLELQSTKLTLSKLLLPGGSPLEVIYSGKSIVMELDSQHNTCNYSSAPPVETNNSRAQSDDFICLYKREILPLQNVIRELKVQIDLLTEQREKLRHKLQPINKLNRDFIGNCGPCKKRF